MFLACIAGHMQIARLLLEKGADRSLKNKNGKNAYDLGIKTYLRIL